MSGFYSYSRVVTVDTATFVTAAGRRATRTVANVDEIEPDLRGFVRSAVRWLDPGFPQKGVRGPGQHGSWTDDQAATEFTQFDELSRDGRGLRIIRLYKTAPPGEPFEGAVRIIVVGAANGARLELRWNFLATENEVRGTSAELTVEGERQYDCIQDFQAWFDTLGN